MSRISVVKESIKGRNIKPLANYTITDQAVAALARIGLIFDRNVVQQQIKHLGSLGAFSGHAMDSAFTAPATTPSIPTPIQFLQTWLPGFVKVMTAARKIDELIGIQTVGSWEDEQIVQGIVEPSAIATEYGDHTNIPLASWNANFETRTVVRGEMGIEVGLLEEGRAAAMRLNSAENKRQGAAVALEIFRNAVGFFGWNNNNNRTFGFLNDPNLPSMVTAPSGGWSAAVTAGDGFQKISGDIRAAIQLLRVQSQDNIDPEAEDLTLALPTTKREYLTVTTDYGVSVAGWLEQTYPKLRVVSAPELMGHGTNLGVDDVFYLFVDSVSSEVDGSTDGGEVFSQLVQTKFITLGVEKKAKSYLEDYSSATAGTLLKRPWAVVRFTGI